MIVLVAWKCIARIRRQGARVLYEHTFDPGYQKVTVFTKQPEIRCATDLYTLFVCRCGSDREACRGVYTPVLAPAKEKQDKHSVTQETNDRATIKPARAPVLSPSPRNASRASAIFASKVSNTSDYASEPQALGAKSLTRDDAGSRGARSSRRIRTASRSARVSCQRLPPLARAMPPRVVVTPARSSPQNQADAACASASTCGSLLPPLDPSRRDVAAPDLSRPLASGNLVQAQIAPVPAMLFSPFSRRRRTSLLLPPTPHRTAGHAGTP